MKALKLVAILAMIFMSFSVQALCPTQQTTIFYINGVDNTTDDAEASKQNLVENLILDPRYSSDCVTVKLAYNKSENRVADFSEALRQKTLEAGLTATNFWEMWERLIPSQNWFVEQFRTAMSTEQVLYDDRDPKIFAQINEHITEYQKEPAENQLLFAAHSQGNFFGNEERLGLLERFPQIGARVKMVSVATPSGNVAGDIKPYTTLTEDKLMANVIGALVPNLTNGTTGGECNALLILLGKVDEYICHGFIESYMVPDSKSRKQIIDNVIAALPTTSSQNGTIIYQPSDSYSLYNESTKLFTAPYCEWLGTEQFSACQFAGTMAFTPSSTTTLGSIQLAIMQQNANDTVTVKVCTTMNCTAGTVLDASAQDLPQILLTSASGTLNSVNQPVFTFSHSAVLTQNTTYYVQVFPATTQVYICSPYNHSAVPTPLFIVRS